MNSKLNQITKNMQPFTSHKIWGFFGNLIGNSVFLIFLVVILSLTLRGLPGVPNINELNQIVWKDNGPLELSPERGRFALTYSLIEDKSVHFSVPVARFATPDLGYKNGNFVSLFAQGVSFVVLPGYLLGKVLGASQVGAYAVIAIFAILNAFLIKSIVSLLGGSKTAGLLASLTFLFATPSFVYAVSLFQHHVSIFLLLMSLYFLVRFKTVWSLVGVWFLAALSLSVDYPNLFMMLPLGIFGLLRLIRVVQSNNQMSIKVNILGFLTFAAAVLPLAFLLWFNQVSYGSPFQLAGTVASVQEIDNNGKPTVPKGNTTTDLQKFTNTSSQSRSAAGFFSTRSMLSAFNIHWISPDRGIIYYCPVILFGFIGLYLAYRKKMMYMALLVSVMAINIVLYSMWGDYWGGWAFGSRYLTPAYAILAIFIGMLLTYWRKKWWFLGLFFIFFSYSVFVNTLGAITSSANPPQVEVLELEKLSGQVQKYTYARNWDYLISNHSKSFVFQTIAHQYITAQEYLYILVAIILIPSVSLMLMLKWSNK